MRKVVGLLYLVFLQPAGLLTWAGFILLFHLVFRALGWRELTTVLSGTFPTGMEQAEAAARATIYLGSYSAAVLVAPVMIIGAVISLVIERRWR
jgi:hypothetical protein